MNRSSAYRPFLSLTSLIVTLLSSVLFTYAQAEEVPGIPTWVMSDRHSGARVETRLSGVSVKILNADKERLETAAALEDNGWMVQRGGVWETPQRAGGDEISFIVSNLPPGRHKVYLRYFAKDRAYGELWWYFSYGELNGKRINLDTILPGRRIVSGLTGQDMNTMYEVLLGEVGDEKEPVSELTFGFERYEWSQFSRIGPARIESYPSFTAPLAIDPEVKKTILSSFVVAPEEAGGLRWAVAPSVLKVRPAHFDSVAGVALSKKIVLSGARGEYENAQILLHAPDGGRIADLAVSPLKLSGASRRTGGDGGSVSGTIAGENSLLAPMGYVAEHSTDNFDIMGFWPDPIMTHMDSFDLRAGLLQSLWFRVFIPRDASSGVYTGAVSFTINGARIEVPVELTVRDIDLPRWSSMPLAMGNTSPHFIQYGVLPGSIYGFPEGDPKEILRDWAQYDAPLYSIGYIPGTSTGIWEQQMPGFDVSQELLEEWATAIRERLDAAEAVNMPGRPYLYLFDEAGHKWEAAIEKTLRYLRKEFPELYMVSTSHLPELWDPEEGFNAWVLITSNLHRSASHSANEIEGVKAKSRDLWIYTCNSPPPPFDNFFVSSSGSGTRRLTGWLPHSHGATGFLYYRTATPGQPVLGNDVFTAWKVRDFGDGDFLQTGPEGPLPSQRMELIRDGLEDHSYITAALEILEMTKERTDLPEDFAALAGRVKEVLAPGYTKIIDEAPEEARIRRDLGNRELLGEFISRGRQFIDFE